MGGGSSANAGAGADASLGAGGGAVTSAAAVGAATCEWGACSIGAASSRRILRGRFGGWATVSGVVAGAWEGAPGSTTEAVPSDSVGDDELGGSADDTGAFAVAVR